MLALCGTLALHATTFSLEPAEVSRPLVVDVQGATTLSAWLAAEGTSLSAHDALVKRGPGTLTNDASIATFDGEIVIEGGRLVATTDGALGSSAGATFVKDGATLEISTVGGCPDFTAETMVVSGDGDSAKAGAIVVSGGQYADKAFGPIQLSQSASVGLQEKSDRILQSIALNGHELTLAGCAAGGDVVMVNGVVSGPGRLVRQGNGFLGCDGASLSAGETAGSILIRTGSGWATGTRWLYTRERAWPIAFEADTMLYHRDGHSPVYEDHYWDGDVTLLGNVEVWRYEGDCQYAFRGKVSGPGGFTVGAGCRLVLANAANDFTGGLVVQADALGVKMTRAGALPNTASGLTLKGGAVELASCETYSLPPLTVDSEAGTVRVSGFAVDEKPYSFAAWDYTKGSWANSVVKRGAGDLLYDTPIGAEVWMSGMVRCVWGRHGRRLLTLPVSRDFGKVISPPNQATRWGLGMNIQVKCPPFGRMPWPDRSRAITGSMKTRRLFIRAIFGIARKRTSSGAGGLACKTAVRCTLMMRKSSRRGGMRSTGRM